MIDRVELLRRAAHCYQQVEKLDDACRCFEAAGDDTSAGRLHAGADRHERAVAAFERATLWQEAADSYLQLGRPRRAASCLLRAEQPLRAAWIFADRAGEPARARALLRDLEAAGPGRSLEAAVVESRCDALETRRQRVAANRLHGVIEAIEEDPGAVYSGDLRAWALATAAALGRPDFAARLHAAAYRARAPGALKEWERWAFEQFGSAEGLPQETVYVPGGQP